MFSASTIVEHICLLKMSATVLETTTACFKEEPHFLIDQVRTCHIFMLCCIRSVFLNKSGNQFILYRVCLETSFYFILAKQRFYLNSRSYYEMSSLCSNKWALYQPRYYCLHLLLTWTTQKVKGSWKVSLFLLKKVIASAHSKISNSSGFNPIVQKFYEMICEIIASKTLCGFFLIFCRSNFINNFMVKSNFLEPRNHGKLNMLRSFILK